MKVKCGTASEHPRYRRETHRGEEVMENLELTEEEKLLFAGTDWTPEERDALVEVRRSIRSVTDMMRTLAEDEMRKLSMLEEYHERKYRRRWALVWRVLLTLAVLSAIVAIVWATGFGEGCCTVT